MGRFTDIGMFWQDLPSSRKRGERVIGPMPEIPETGWRPPTEFPNLSAAKVIGLDTETYDPELKAAGPGWGRGQGHIVGVSLAVEDGTSWYFPIRHETQPDMNLAPENVLAWLRHVLRSPVPKVGANLIYDVGWLLEEGVQVGGMLYDVQFAEALLNSEEPRVALDDLAERYLGRGKETSLLYDWLASWLGGAANDRQRANLYKAPVTLAGPYAEADAALPIQILNRQWAKLDERRVLDLFHIECRLIPLLVKMRMKGAPIDVGRAEQIYEELGGAADVLADGMKQMVGQPVNPAASESMKSAFNRLGLVLPEVYDKKQGKNRISFAADVLEQIDHPFTKLVVEHRQTLKVRDTFIKSYLIDKQVNGRVHCTFHPLKGTEGGTRSGRFSSSGPNLQNIPVRTELGKRVRSCFVAHSQAKWRKWDYSQIEYRLLAHHAVGQGADDLRARFVNDPDADYHELTIKLVLELTGMTLDRRPAKTINFGLIYGMSQAELARRLGLRDNSLFDAYHRAAPFARSTMDAAAEEVHAQGYIETLLGRRSDFPLWGPVDKYGVPGLRYEAALREYGPAIKRAFTHKALNRKLQGGAADVMKKAMVDAYEAGLFEDYACGIPLLTVHDELDFEDFGDPNAACWAELRQIMENCVAGLVRIPLKVDCGSGPDWATAD